MAGRDTYEDAFGPRDQRIHLGFYHKARMIPDGFVTHVRSGCSYYRSSQGYYESASNDEVILAAISPRSLSPTLPKNDTNGGRRNYYREPLAQFSASVST